MKARALVINIVSAITDLVDVPVYSFDTNETRELPCVIVAYDSVDKHPLLDAETVRVSVAVYSNGHITSDPEAILQTIFSSLSVGDISTEGLPVYSADYDGTSTNETETATIHTAYIQAII